MRCGERVAARHTPEPRALLEAKVIALAEWLVYLAGIYLLIGVIFAAAFVAAGVSQIDAAAKGAPLGFRLLIFPGAAALWPYLLARWLSKSQAPRQEHNAHRDAAREMKR